MALNDKEMEQAILKSNIVLTLTVNETNQILSIIGKYPFEEVQNLIRRIQDEGQPQINAIAAKLTAASEAAEAAEKASLADVLPD